MWVVRSRRWSRKQDQSCAKSGSFMRAPNEVSADTSPLIRNVYRKVREIRAIVEIGDGPRYSDQEAGLGAGGYDDARL
jgi:hypothetical protein